jgi:hypothetical protein
VTADQAVETLAGLRRAALVKLVAEVAGALTHVVSGASVVRRVELDGAGYSSSTRVDALTRVTTTIPAPHWFKTPIGYELRGYSLAATLTRLPGRWSLEVAGETHYLGDLASFDPVDALVLDAARRYHG